MRDFPLALKTHFPLLDAVQHAATNGSSLEHVDGLASVLG